MVIILDKKEFADAVASVARFAQRTSASLPVLAGIAIIAGDDGIKLRATNLETGIDLSLSGTIKETGVVALPASVLREITASLTGTGPLTLEQSGSTVTVTTGTGTSTLKTLPYEDFPVLPLPESPKVSFSLPGAVLRSLIISVAGYASVSTVRPELASVYLRAEGGNLIAVATDSFRLAEKKISLSDSIPPFTMLIPAKNALDIVQTIPDTQVEVALDDHQCSFSWKGGLVTTRLVSANYPDYAQIIPKESVGEAKLLKKDLEAALKRTAVFSDAFQKIKVGFDVKGKCITLSSQNSDVGESSESVPGSLQGESVDLSFNHRYLSAPLSSLSSESITLSASGIGRAMILRGAGDASFLYLVMPMNQ
jgi:DNA polymerase-3 subunit beta